MPKTYLQLHGLTARFKINVYLIRSRKSRNDRTSNKGSDGKLSRLSAMDVAILVANADSKPRPLHCDDKKACPHAGLLSNIAHMSPHR